MVREAYSSRYLVTPGLVGQGSGSSDCSCNYVLCTDMGA